MDIRIVDNGYEQHRELLRKCITERIPANFENTGMMIELCVDEKIGTSESYLVRTKENGYQITGADEAGLYYGIGKFLHTAKWSDNHFIPDPPTKVISPNSSFRAIYFAVHFNNWYDEAPTEELENYLEELLLYGYNTVIGLIPVVCIDSYEDEFFVRAVAKTRSIFKLAKNRGMKAGLIMPPNQGMRSAPHEYDADLSYEQTEKVLRGALGRNLCPSIPEAVQYLRSIWTKEFEQYSDIGLDYVLISPYDEGGCGCEKCRPWGARGYCELAKEVYKEAKKEYPDSKFILSTWLYDTPGDEGEFSGLYERLKSDLSFVDYIMVDSHNKFPRYPLEHEVIKPIVNFPEISMWKLHPWGGRGANPMPKRFQAIWDEVKHILKGGMPYSEGLYEDISKMQCIGYYWDADRNYKDILSEYINYEYSGEVCDEVIEMMELIEVNHVKVAQLEKPDMSIALKAEELADTIDAMLSARVKKTWRWRILYIRAKIDKMVYEYFLEKGYKEEDGYNRCRYTPEEWLADNEEAQALLQELCRYYHCIDRNPQNHNQYTLPPVKDGKVLN